MKDHRENSVFDEAQYRRLRVLADSVNETARMARTTLSLLLLVALYLALTLGASSDENLLYKGQVVLPQVGAGLPVVQSYIFAPLVFLFMHGHALFMLSVLARKVRTFDDAVRKELFNARASGDEAQMQQRECRDWLSAFAFVQIFQEDAMVSRVSRELIWLATSAIPLTLLVVIDISFLRYQSHPITWIHHITFLFDLGLVVFFHWEVFGQREVKTPRRIGTRIKGLAAVAMVLLLLFAAHPPSENESPQSIWRHGVAINYKELFGTVLGLHNLLDVGPCKAWEIGCRYLKVDFRNSEIKEKKLSLAGRSLRFAIFNNLKSTNMNFRKTQLQRAQFVKAVLKQADFREAHLEGAILQDAELQQANFENAWLQGANLKNAKLKKANLKEARLEGAILEEAELYEVDFKDARLQEAILEKAKLKGAKLQEAKLQNTNLSRAALQGMNLSGAELQGANLSEVKLQMTNLSSAQLQGAIFFKAQLQGANLSGAELQGADFQLAQLQGANLSGAKLQGANLSEAYLQGTNLSGAELQGANLRNVKLQCSFGQPLAWDLIWMPGAVFSFPSSSNQKSTCSSLPRKLEQCLKDMIPDDIADIKLAGKESVSLKDQMRKRLKNCPKRQLFDGAKPQKDDMVFYDREALSGPLKDWPEPAAINSPRYLETWQKWTVEFACHNVHTARSSFRRWKFDTLRFENEDSGSVKYAVLKVLIGERKNKKNCLGIAAIPDEEWKHLAKMNE